MEKPKIKLRLEDIQVDSFVTSDALNAQTIQGGTYFNTGCCGSPATVPMLDGGCGGGGGGNQSAPNPCGTNVPNCTNGVPCYSNSACNDVSCADFNVSWCCVSQNQQSDCQTCGTCQTGCPC